eukprot:2389501-Pleurochrysis_carterae.AAC.1
MSKARSDASTPLLLTPLPTAPQHRPPTPLNLNHAKPKMTYTSTSNAVWGRTRSAAGRQRRYSRSAAYARMSAANDATIPRSLLLLLVSIPRIANRHYAMTVRAGQPRNERKLRTTPATAAGNSSTAPPSPPGVPSCG